MILHTDINYCISFSNTQIRKDYSHASQNNNKNNAKNSLDMLLFYTTSTVLFPSI